MRRVHHRGVVGSPVEVLENRRLFSTIVVNTVNDIVYPVSQNLTSLRAAVQMANAATTATTISFDPTVFASTQTIALSTNSASITVNSTEPVTITGPASQVILTGAVTPLAVAGGTVSISNLAFSGTGNSALIQNGGTLTLSSDVIENATYDGLVISGNSGTTKINNCLVQGNKNVGLVIDAVTTVTDTTVTQNTDDGVIVNGTATINGCDIAANTGPGLYVEGGVTSLENSTVSGNTASYGAGIRVYSGTCDATDCTISGNKATGNGGGVEAQGPGFFGVRGAVNLVNSTLYGNTAGGNGGAIEADGVTSIVDCTIANNSTAGKGGGLSTTVPLQTTVGNTIIASNTATTTAGTDDVNNNVTSDGNNLISATTGTEWTGSDITGTVANPINANLAAPANNGGATLTLLPQAPSLAIGGGSTALVPTGITTDQRGFARIVSGKVDIGAVESQPVIITAPPQAQSTSLFLAKAFQLGSFSTISTAGPFNVIVSWGDGSPATTFQLVTTGSIPAQTHTYDTAGTFNASVTIANALGTVTNTEPFLVTVQSGGILITPPTAQTANVNQSTAFTLGSFTATDSTAPFGVVVNWGDGSSTTFGTSTAGTLASQLHTYSTTNTFTATITVTDATGTVTNNATFAVTVVSASITVTPPATQTASVGVSNSIDLGTFSGLDTTGPYTVAVNWGDNTPDASFTVDGPGPIPAQQHAYDASGPQSASVTVTDANGVAGSADFQVSVTAGTQASSVALTATAAAIESGQPDTFTATVSPASATGSITFEENGIALGSPVAIVGGTAALTTSGLAQGTLSVTASYSGSATNAAAVSAPLTVTVSAVQTGTMLALSAPTSLINTSQSVTLTALLTPSALGSTDATGMVSFTGGGAVLGTAMVQPNGDAVLTTTSPFAPGTVSINATYSGDANFGASSTTTPVNITVAQTVTATTLAIGSPSVTVGQFATFTATVSPSPVTPSTLSSLNITGSVTFSVDGTPIGTAPVGTGGVAALTTNTPLPVGIGTVVASYAGDASYVSSNSSQSQIAVTQQALVPNVTKASVPATVVAGAAVSGYVTANLTNLLSGAEAGSETGQVSVSIYASNSTTSLNTAGEPLVAQVMRNVNVKEGKSIRIKVPITSFPIDLSGNYQLLLQTTDARGNAQVIAVGSTMVQTAVISLQAAFSSVPRNVLKAGALIALSQSPTANVNDTSVFTANISVSTDQEGQNIVASGTGTVSPTKVRVRLGKTTKVKVKGWGALLSTLPAGTYYLTVTLTDANGNSVFAVSPTPVV